MGKLNHKTMFEICSWVVSNKAELEKLTSAELLEVLRGKVPTLTIANLDSILDTTGIKVRRKTRKSPSRRLDELETTVASMKADLERLKACFE